MSIGKLQLNLNSFIAILFFILIFLFHIKFDSYSMSTDKESRRYNNPYFIDSDDERIIKKKIYVDFKAPYATYSIINDDSATLYKLKRNKVDNYKNKTVAINAGHGTKGGEKIKTFSHPDFTPKVAGGSTAKGEILSAAVSLGTTFLNKMTEAEGNLLVANELKNKLLDDGYNVLMIRENDDCRLDNIARTVIANVNADIHIAIHFDSTDYNKGIFYIAPYSDKNYLNMEPLKSNIDNIKLLGDSVISAYKSIGEKIWNKGILGGDLTQLSYSTNPSIDIELGDRKTNLTEEKINKLAEGLKNGIELFFEKQYENEYGNKKQEE